MGLMMELTRPSQFSGRESAKKQYESFSLCSYQIPIYGTETLWKLVEDQHTYLLANLYHQLIRRTQFDRHITINIPEARWKRTTLTKPGPEFSRYVLNRKHYRCELGTSKSFYVPTQRLRYVAQRGNVGKVRGVFRYV
jgi:hypothetical protein